MIYPITNNTIFSTSDLNLLVLIAERYTACSVKGPTPTTAKSD